VDEQPDPVDERALLGSTVGEYLIESEIGRGGMGVVYAATHTLIGKRAAIKVIHAQLSKKPATVERFVQEARAVNQIGHPNIVDIFGFGALPDGRSYLIMDLLVGESLRRRIKRGRIPIPEAAHILEEVVSALAAAHGKGFIHRDIKSDNVFLVDHGSHYDVKLLDFGLAKLATGAGPARAYRTATGAMLGTPDYMSPEQLRGSDGIDYRTDIYALGVVVFEMLTRSRPKRYSDGSFELDGVTIPQFLARECGACAELGQLIEAMLAHARENRPSLDAIRAVIKRLRESGGLEPVSDAADTTEMRPVQPTPPSGALTIPNVPSVPVHAGLAKGPVHASTKLGVPPAPARPNTRHPVAAARRDESRTWLFVGLAVVVIAAIALVVVLVS
jgi:eukaryotic-like serine/threonine-protein kinase